MDRFTVLIVEDDIDIAEIFRMAFIKCGFEVEVALNGQVALEHLVKTTPRVVVLDLRLPQVSGGEILRYMHSEDRLVKSFIIITSADPNLAANYREQADMVLVKPITYSELRDLANSLVASLAED